ncbi:MAG: 3-keto-5-aminohexanoate cleavage protein [Armatimonadetes bacterium]|nr:3-keto-5-aminohexanoate cleavage protein [Armatimonadota bacterium]
MLAGKPVIINAALTGMVPTKEDTPHVPITIEEIAADVEGVADAGASVVHLHPRDENGQPTCDPEIYRRLIGTVRTRCPDIIICASCSGRIESDVDARGVALSFDGDLKPDMASLTCGSMNFPDQASVNAPQTIVELARRMKDRGIKPEVEVFEPGMINYARYLIHKNLLDEPIYVNILLGNLGTSPATAASLSHMMELLPEGSVWSCAGIGRYQLTVNTLALAMGGHVRVGLEDNPSYDWDERTPATNRMLVERVVRIGTELGRRPATPQEAREMIGLPPKRL